MAHRNHRIDLTSPVTTLNLSGERLCLDFTNTLDPRAGSHPRDFLLGYPDLVTWGRYVGLLTDERAQRLLQEALHRSDEAAAAFERAIVLREAIYRVFSAIADGRVASRSDLDLIQRSFAQAMSHAHLISPDRRFEWAWDEHEEEFDCILWPVLLSAIELLTSDESRRVKECPGIGDCGWLFLDTSKNGSRQWCSMEDCGSRAKMRRLYARKRAHRSSS
jgi:predicted RNA-binding Zn ribbon-like protein